MKFFEWPRISHKWKIVEAEYMMEEKISDYREMTLKGLLNTLIEYETPRYVKVKITMNSILSSHPLTSLLIFMCIVHINKDGF